MKRICVGLFGTCGNSKWRDSFINKYKEKEYDFFNPNKEDWKPEDAEIEAEHLVNDEIILFPITGETYATGSLAEVGFSILNAIKLNERRDFIIMIDNNLDEGLKNDSLIYKESIRARAIVKQHLKKMQLANLYIVENLDQMLEVSLCLYEANLSRLRVSKFSSVNIL